MINWYIVDREWEVNGTMRADKAIWYLLGEYEPISGVLGYEEKWRQRGGEFHSLKDALFTAGAVVDCERVRKRVNYFRDAFGRTQEETLSEKREFLCLAYKDRLLAFYEGNRALGRPPFLFEDVRHVALNEVTCGWPWGTHETKLLQDLAAAANRFWKNHDPNEIDTMPTNAAVSSWLKEERKLSDSMAGAIATILRSNRAPTGRRGNG